MEYTLCSMCLVLAIALLWYTQYHTNEYFRLSKELTNKYLAIRANDLKMQYGEEAWNHCMYLMKLQLRWSQDESEIPTIEKKEFPCGNTVEKCLIEVTKDMANGIPINPMSQKIIDMANA